MEDRLKAVPLGSLQAPIDSFYTSVREIMQIDQRGQEFSQIRQSPLVVPRNVLPI